jgi:adenine deaminase
MKADYIVNNVKVFLTFRKTFEDRCVAVKEGRILAVLQPSAAKQMFPDTAVIDGGGRYLIPGFVDIHMHIESSMTYPAEFSRIALPHGTTTIVADAHEIANVFGLEGIRSFMEQKTEMDIFYAIPSSVPATNERLETSGAAIGEEETAALLERDEVLCLGEVMNFQELAPEDDRETKIRRLIRLCQEKRGRDIRLEGHCPGLRGADLNRFLYEGVDADHTQQTAESVVEKSDLGMFLELQMKSLTQETLQAVCDHNLYENVALVTDDTMPDHLLSGHLNRIVRAAVQKGMRAEDAIYCATYTPARRMHLDDRGIIAPGKIADFLLLNDLKEFEPDAVFKSGRCVKISDSIKINRNFETSDASSISVLFQSQNLKKDFDYKKEIDTSKDSFDLESVENDRCNSETNHHESAKKQFFPEHFYHSISCKEAREEDFKLIVDRPCSKVRVNVMQISTFGTVTKAVQRILRVENGTVCWQEAGLSLAVIFERYGKNGNISYGLVEGAFTKEGAAATTWSHDSHNLLVLGTNPRNMKLAQNRICKLEGGYVAAAKGTILAEVPLRIGGIISDEPLTVLAEKLGKVRAAMEALGYENNNVIMSMSTLALPVSPALKLTDYGLLDVKTQNRVELIEEYL